MLDIKGKPTGSLGQVEWQAILVEVLINYSSSKVKYFLSALDDIFITKKHQKKGEPLSSPFSNLRMLR